MKIIDSVNLFSLISGYYTTCNIKSRTNAKLSLYLKKAGLASRNIVHLKKRSFYVVSTSAFIFFILYVKPIRSLLIQRIPAGSSFRLLV